MTSLEFQLISLRYNNYILMSITFLRSSQVLFWQCQILSGTLGSPQLLIAPLSTSQLLLVPLGFSQLLSTPLIFSQFYSEITRLLCLLSFELLSSHYSIKDIRLLFRLSMKFELEEPTIKITFQQAGVANDIFRILAHKFEV